MGGGAWTVLCVIALTALISSTLTRSKRKITLNSDDTNNLVTSSSQSDDAVSGDVEVEARPKPKRNKEVVTDSSNTVDKRQSGANSGPHVCRFCGLQFAQSQALGGHMNKHRSEKEQEELKKAHALVAQRARFCSVVNQSPHYNMQGGGGYFPPYMDSSLTGQYFLPNQSAAALQLPVNQGFAAPQQNAQMGFLQQQGGPSAGAYYAPMDSTRPYSYGIPAQRAANPAQQFYAPGINSGQAGYVDSKSVMHGGVDQCGLSIFHSNVQGETSTGSHLQDFSNFRSNNMASNNQQVQSNITIPSESYILQKSAEQQQIINSSDAIQFVDEHGNPAQDNLPGHPISFPMRNESHEQEGFPMHSALDVHPDFPDGADQTTILVDSGQTSFETDTSIDDHNSVRLQKDIVE